jgi:hypothetical protein
LNELSNCVEPLGSAPAQLPADDFSGPHHARRTRARAGRNPNTAEGVSQGAHLFVTRRVCKL